MSLRAEAHGLHIEKHIAYGWTITTLTEETVTWLAVQPGMESFTVSRKTLLPVTITGDYEEGEGEATLTTIEGGHQISMNRRIKYVCPVCRAIIRATKQFNVVCGDCNVAFKKV